MPLQIEPHFSLVPTHPKRSQPMKDQSPPPMDSCMAQYLAKRLANGSDYPVYKGPESLEESNASHFIVPMLNRMGFCRVRREAIENGVPDDDTLCYEALVGGIEGDFPEEF